MNLLCKFQYSNKLIRVPVEKAMQPHVEDFTQKWDLYNKVRIETERMTCDTQQFDKLVKANEGHWASAWLLYDWLVPFFRALPLLNDLPDAETHSPECESGAAEMLIKFCPEDRLDLMKFDLSKTEVVDYDVIAPIPAGLIKLNEVRKEFCSLKPSSAKTD